MGPSSEEDYDSDLEVVEIVGRNPLMPTIFKAKAHPLHPTSNPGQLYVYYTWPTDERMQESLQAGESMKIPIGKDGELNGLLCLQPGDYLWTRNELGSRDPKDDVLVGWVVPAALRDEGLKAKVDAARDMFMGPEDKITADSVEFKRLKPRPKPVKKGTRCWTLGLSLEPNTNIEAPCANGKWKGETTEYHKTVRELVTSSTAMAMEDMSHAPEEVKDVLKSEFERHGMAPLGYTGNYAYHAVQCNLAYAGIPMEEQMGRYAGIHRDQNDCPGHYSTMITRSRLPNNYRPPRIVLPGLGVFTNLDDFVGFTFHGQLEHVGMAPYPLPGTPPSPTAYRFALIHYTPQRMATAKTRQRIGALPNTHALLNPEMRSSKVEKDVLKGLQNDSFANFLRDGLWIMEDEGYVDYIGRAAYQFIRYLLTQTQGRFKFELDPTALAHAITYLDDDGNRKSVAPWEMAPSVQEDATDRDNARAASEARFEEHMFKHGSMIPLFYMQNAWVRAETARRYGGGITGQVASGEADHMSSDPESFRAGGSDQMLDVEPAIAGHVNYNLRKRKRVETNAEASGEDERKRKRVDMDAEASGEDEEEGTEDRVEDAGYSTGALKARQKGKKPVAATRPALEEEVLELRTELQAIQEIEDDDDDDEATCEEIRLSIGNATQAMEIGGLGDKALNGVGIVKADVQRLERYIAREENLLRSSRATLIKAQMGLRTWVEGPVTDKIIATAKRARVSKSSSQSWVASLTNAVVDMFVFREEKRTFKASDYGLDWECDEVEIINVEKGKNMLRGEERTVKSAVRTAVMIVENWVDVDRYCDRKQAWFASVVEEVMGEEALSMSIIWRLYRNVKTSHIFRSDKGYRAPTKEDMAPFRAALESHSVLESDHIEGQLFDLYRKLWHNDIAPSEIVKHLPNISPRWKALVQMIEVAMIYDNDEEPQHASRYLKKLLSDPLTYHPLRECSPNRRHCVLDLFSGGGCVSKEAIFSLLVSRAFPQVFSWHPDSTMLYSTPADFLAAYRAIMKKEPPEAIVEVVGRYWEVLEERRWTKFADTSPSFERCYEHFKPRGYLENRLFPKLSKTNAFDVACDLVYAGFCEPPTTADVVYHIVHINQGAMSGLKALGLVDGKKKDIETKRAQVHQALLDLGYLLKDVPGFTRDDDDEVPYLPYEHDQVDPMAIEHLLHVFSHAHKYLA